MNLLQLLSEEDTEGIYEITKTPSELWLGTNVTLNIRTYKEVDNCRSIRVISVKDKRLKNYIDKPLPIVGAITVAEFTKKN
ncbi:hypothetical protein P9X10_02195 [Bacillus cereus]|nr:hypothetical protein [Bacillus cereus]